MAPSGFRNVGPKGNAGRVAVEVEVTSQPTLVPQQSRILRRTREPLDPSESRNAHPKRSAASASASASASFGAPASLVSASRWWSRIGRVIGGKGVALQYQTRACTQPRSSNPWKYVSRGPPATYSIRFAAGGQSAASIAFDCVQLCVPIPLFRIICFQTWSRPRAISCFSTTSALTNTSCRRGSETTTWSLHRKCAKQAEWFAAGWLSPVPRVNRISPDCKKPARQPRTQLCPQVFSPANFLHPARVGDQYSCQWADGRRTPPTAQRPPLAVPVASEASTRGWPGGLHQS